MQESLKLEPEEVGDEYEEDEEEDLEEVEEDEVIIEDRKNFSGCSDIMLDDSSSGPSTSKVDPLPSDVKSGFASFTKRSRRTNGQSDGGQPPKIPKCEDEVIVLSD